MATTEVSASALDGLADRPDLRWSAFAYGMLVLLHELRERARTAAVPGASTLGPGPEDTADELLDEIAAVGAEANVDPQLVDMALDVIQRALHRHTTVPGRWGSWAALRCAVQEAADRVALTVAALADEMVEARDEYQRTATDEDVASTVASMNRVIDMMQMAVVAVRGTEAARA